MGLTNKSVGFGAVSSSLDIRKQTKNDIVVALAGNPNVGKSTIFNALTGLNQHTGNWPGKTVTNAQGYTKGKKHNFVLVDIPGTYSLMAHSGEEEIARNFICFAKPDLVVVVCDATCLERNLNLVLQTMEISSNVIVCLNLMDEAKRKNIKINTKLISKRLGVPIIETVAHKKKTLSSLVAQMEKNSLPKEQSFLKIEYDLKIEEAVSFIEEELLDVDTKGINKRWLALKLLDEDESLKNEIENCLGKDFLQDITPKINKAREELTKKGIDSEKLKDLTVSALVKKASDICDGAVTYEKEKQNNFDRKMDKLLTSKYTAYPFMLILLGFIFWLTIQGANYPSKWLSALFFFIEEKLFLLFELLKAPPYITDMLVNGVYKVLSWVVSVMLPPMAIFFPLFTLLEDAGYLPRVAYNLDKPFKKCCACGKQALTMCMGFGCNAAGVVGARIIDSSRERLLAILTNNFVPCNGRFPTLISIITMFFVWQKGFSGSILSALMLMLVIVLGVGVTFIATTVLSKTLLKGVPSSFTLELPPYRKPRIGEVIVHSIFDRTLFVLGRAVIVAAPAGLIIWLMANAKIDGVSLLNICSNFLDPFARLLGLDGIILFAFILGFPANEIVLPIILMAYTSAGTLIEMDSLSAMRDILIQNGWTQITALNTMLFSLMHFPCSTTLITIKKETGSIWWTLLAFLLPTVTGIIFCMTINFIAKIF